MLSITRYSLALVLLLSPACGWFSGKGSALPHSREAWIGAVLAAEDRRDPDDPLLVLAVEHDDPVVRAFAYRAFERIGDPSKIALILNSARQEGDAEMRAKAILAIAGTESGRILDAVEPFVLDPSFVTRRAVARAVGRAKSDQAIPRLFGMMSDTDPDVRAEAAYGIARRVAADKGSITARSLPAFRALAGVATSDPYDQVRAAACYALSKAEQPEFGATFVAALTDANATVRAFAAVGLQTIETNPEAKEALKTALGDPQWIVAVEAAKALERGATDDIVKALGALVSGEDGSQHPSFQVRAAAAKALASATNESIREFALATLRRAANDSSPTVRAETLDSIVQLAAAYEAFAACEKLSYERSGFAAPFLRSRAAASASRIANEAGFPIVERLLNDSEPAVKAAAVAVLPSFKSRATAVATALEAALAFPDVAPREAAATAIAEMKLESLAPRLLAALSESSGPENVEARISILKAIGSFEKFGLATSLEQALDDEEPEVRRVAAEQIARLGGLLPRGIYREPPKSPVAIEVGTDVLSGEERPRVEIVTTQGPFVLELLVDDAPAHSKAFLQRCRAGFYDGLIFHRLVPGFVVQGLDPRGDGYGTGGASLRSEVNQVRYDRGTVGMPDAGKDTGGCQIFVTFRAQPRLDDRYTIFARVTEGMENVERLDVGDRVLYVLIANDA